MELKEKQLESKLIFDGKIVHLYEDKVMCPNGNIATREYIKHNGGVCILAIVDNKVIMERQFRYPYNEVVFELPAGKLEKGEDPYEAGIRELEEETGYKAKNLESFGVMYPSCGYSNEIIHLYKANGLTKTKRHLDIDENINIEYVDISKIKELLLDNKIVDAKTICLLSKYLLKGQNKNDL